MTDTKSLDFLTPQQVEKLWGHIEPMLEASCEGNEISKGSLTSKDIYDLAIEGQCGIFLYSENNIPTLVLAIQFFMEGNIKGVEFIALGGKNLTSFRKTYWKSILDWFSANKVKIVDAHVAPEWVDVYRKRFGFQKSCSLVRMSL